MASKASLSLLFPFLLAGCAASVTHQRENSDSDGIRYYMNAPYLIVYSNGRGGLQWQIRYLPDQTKVMTAKPHVFGARLEMTMNFQNGVLATSSVSGDSAGVPKAVIAAVQNVLPLLAKAAAGTPTTPGFPAPSLYKIVVNGDNVTFIGAKGDVSIQVPINAGKVE